MVELRDYQRRALQEIAKAEKNGVTRQLVLMATGLGKSMTFSGLLTERGIPPTFGFMHREELLEQMKSTILTLNPTATVGIEKAELKANPDLDKIILASVQTVGKKDRVRLGRFLPSWPKIILADEAHHCPSESYLNVLDYFGVYGDNPDRSKLVIGLTATPDRLDEMGYDKIFDDVTFRYDLQDAIRDGWLADVRATRIKTDVDLSHVKTRMGDFNEKELAEAVKNSAIDKMASQTWSERCRGKRSLFFCVDKEHARRFHEKIVELGAKAAVVVDDTKRDERRSAVELFKSGDIEALVGVGVFTEGFDAPATEFIHMLRPTQSRALYQQMLGRGTRKAPGKDFVDVFDYTAQYHDVCSVGQIFGLPDAWELRGQSITKDAEKLKELEAELGLATETAVSIDDLIHKAKEKRIELIRSTLTDSGLPSKLSWKRPNRSSERWFISWTNETPEGLTKIPQSQRSSAKRIIGEKNLWGTHERIEIFRNEIGGYEAKISRRSTEGIDRSEKIDSDKSVTKLVSRIEKLISEKRPYKLGLLKKNAAWANRPCSEKQAEILKRKGVPEGILGSLTQGDASQLISTPKETITRWFSGLT